MGPRPFLQASAADQHAAKARRPSPQLGADDGVAQFRDQFDVILRSGLVQNVLHVRLVPAFGDSELAAGEVRAFAAKNGLRDSPLILGQMDQGRHENLLQQHKSVSNA